MPDNSNNDVINDILRELETKNDNPPPPPPEDIPDAPTEFPDEPEEESLPDFRAESLEPPTIEDNGYDSISAEPERSAAPTERSASPPMRNGSMQPPPHRKKKKKKKKQRNRLPGVLILTVFIFAVSICLSLVIIAFGKDVLGIGKSDTTHLIIVPEGATTEDIATMLKDEGIIKSPECFKLFSRLRKSDNAYMPGEHFVRPNMAYETIIKNLTSIEEAEKVSVEVTFPEGLTIYDAADILEENGVCSADDFIFYFNSGGFGFEFEDKLASDTSLKFNRMEGFVFPDTYYFYEDMEPEQVCQKIYLNFDNKMTAERYAQMEKLGLSLDQLVTFASIVQKEAATTDTMTMVASVFWNRLRNSDDFPQLQSDPTSNYANDVIRPHMDVFSQEVIDAYDTYVGTGLPPGAICNPGLEAIDAVLADFHSEYYYFYANIYTGETKFAVTYDEHIANEEQIKQDIDEYIASSEAAEQEAANAEAEIQY